MGNCVNLKRYTEEQKKTIKYNVIERNCPKQTTDNIPIIPYEEYIKRYAHIIKDIIQKGNSMLNVNRKSAEEDFLRLLEYTPEKYKGNVISIIAKGLNVEIQVDN